MDLTSPMRSLIPSLDSAALDVLARSESALGLAQISRLSGRGSGPGLARVLDRMVDDGLVIAIPASRGHLYRFNHRHLLADSVHEALEVRPRLIERLRISVDDLVPAIAHASIFGSLARGEGHPGSDIDLLIVTDSDLSADGRWAEQLRALEDDVLAWTGNRLEILEFSLPELRDLAVHGAEPVLDSLRAESIPLTGAPFIDLVDDLVATPAQGS